MDLLSPELGLFVWTLLAFLTVFYILGKFAWKPIIKSLSEREGSIADSIATADRVKKEMAQLKNENEVMMQQAREERSQMLKEAKETRDKIVNEAKELAKAEANKIIADAQQQIHHQKMAALTEVKNEIGNLAVAVAEKVLRKELADTDAQSKYANVLAGEINMN